MLDVLTADTPASNSWHDVCVQTERIRIELIPHRGVQAPRAYYLLCKEVYTKCGMTQLASDECVFIRYVQNIKGASAVTAEDVTAENHLLFWTLDPKACNSYITWILLCLRRPGVSPRPPRNGTVGGDLC